MLGILFATSGHSNKHCAYSCNQDCDHIWVLLTILLRILQKSHTVTTYFYHCHGVTRNHKQFLDRPWQIMPA